MRVWFWRREARETELDEEVRTHLDMATQARVERGANQKEAERAARREFGNVGLMKDVTRDVWGRRWLEDLMEDALYGLRMLRKNPAFAATAILTLAPGHWSEHRHLQRGQHGAAAPAALQGRRSLGDRLGL